MLKTSLAAGRPRHGVHENSTHALRRRRRWSSSPDGRPSTVSARHVRVQQRFIRRCRRWRPAVVSTRHAVQLIRHQILEDDAASDVGDRRRRVTIGRQT